MLRISFITSVLVTNVSCGLIEESDSRAGDAIKRRQIGHKHLSGINRQATEGMLAPHGI